MTMSLEQANYCDNLKTGNIETWDKGFSVLDLSVEKDQIPTGRLSMFRARKNKFASSEIANRAIIRCIHGL